MNIWILHDTLSGNGKILADRLADSFRPDHEVTVEDVKKIVPQAVADANPDAVIFGSAVRAFHNSDNIRKFFKSLEKIMKQEGKHVKYGAIFLTHVLPHSTARIWGNAALRTIQKSAAIKNTFPEFFSGRVVKMEGPFESGTLENADVVAERLNNWMRLN